MFQAFPVALPDEVIDFEGTAADLAEQCKVALQASGLEKDVEQANERLVRHYVQPGVLTPPVRRGREAHFGARQVAEFVIARMLLRDGWPLAKIAELVKTYQLPLPLGGGEPAAPTEAERAIAKIHASTMAHRVGDFDAPKVSFQKHAGARKALASEGHSLAQAAELSARRMELSETLRALGNEAGQVIREEVLKIRLTSWATVEIDVRELRRCGTDAAEALGKALAEALRQEQFSGGDKR
jgi:DNA-binding transcriptional MerR regulator